MVSLPSIRDTLGALGKKLSQGSAIELQEDAQLKNETTALFDYKRQALEMAHDAAAARGDGSKPTMTDYFIAAQQLGETQRHEMASKGIKWNPRVIADLSGQSIDGFQINKSDMQPRHEVLQMAMLRAASTARENGTKAKMSDVLKEVQRIQINGEKIDGSSEAVGLMQKGIESLEDAMDLDGNATIGFYEAIDQHANFKGTVFSNVSFHPAGTLMRDGENGVALTDGASFSNVVFDGMTPDDTLSLKRGDYVNIQFRDIRGGNIEIADGTQVDGMDIRGAQASLSIGRASVSRLDARGAHLVHLEASPGAEINQATFAGATIDMASSLDGSVWKHVQFSDANLVDVNMAGATLSNVHFTNTSLDGLNLAGASLTNVTFQGSDVANVDFSGARLSNVTVNGLPVRSPEDVAMVQQLQEVRGILQNATNSLNQPARMSEPSAALAATTEPVSPALNTGLRLEVADASLADIGRYSAGKDGVGKVQPEVGSSIAMPGSNQA
jgi:uncharacterized protein YjbI with pentapeptide repeats